MIKDQPISASIVIVSWNVREQLRTNLRNLFAVPDRKNFEVIVVDNDSKDGTNRMIRDEFPDVRVVCNDFNAGFAKACNQGIALAKGEVIILLNPDMVVHAGSIDRVYEELMNNPEVGVAGIKLVNKDGHPINNVRRFPDFASQLSLVLKLNHLFPSLMRVYEAADFDYSVTQDVDQVRGSFFTFRKSLTEKIGLLDEGYFIWLEEVDFCKRVHEAGLKVRYLADASAEDLVGRSFAKVVMSGSSGSSRKASSATSASGTHNGRRPSSRHCDRSPSPVLPSWTSNGVTSMISCATCRACAEYEDCPANRQPR